MFNVTEIIHVAALLKLMSYANSRDSMLWSAQSATYSQQGVYGAAQHALELIATAHYGKNTANRIMDRFIELASEFSIDELREAVECAQEEEAADRELDATGA